MGFLKDWLDSMVPEACLVCERPLDRCLCGMKQAQTIRIKPRLARVTRAPGREEWTQWRENPTTEFVMAALRRNADEHADQWHDISWNGGVADQSTLDALRERADALRGIAEADYEAFCETLGLEPEAAQNAA